MLRLLLKLDYLATATGNLVAPLTFVMMLLTCIVVTARYAFNQSLIPVLEAVMYLHAAVFMLGISYTLKAGGHVRVDILYQRLSRRVQACIELGGGVFFLLPTAGFILYSSLDYVALSWRLNEASAEPGGLPGIYLLKSLIPLTAILLLLQALAEIARALLRLLGKDGAAASAQEPLV